jgi:hypothetical protein
MRFALPAARSYAKIAPSSPHVLHMRSHIFTRLGLWQESIESNIAFAADATNHVAAHGRAYSFRPLRALESPNAEAGSAFAQKKVPRAR